jgi:hypothetical protein
LESVLDGDRVLPQGRLDLLEQLLRGRHLLDLGALGDELVGVGRLELEQDRLGYLGTYGTLWHGGSGFLRIHFWAQFYLTIPYFCFRKTMGR